MMRCVTFFSSLYKAYWHGGEEKGQDLSKVTEVFQDALEQVRKNEKPTQKNTLDGFQLLELPPELILKISSHNPTCFFRVNRELHGIFLNEMNQQNWFAHLSLLERIWPELSPQLSTIEKNRAILQEIRTFFTPAEFEQILGKPRFCGSADEIRSIDRAYKEREDFATIALYTAIGKLVPALACLSGSLAEQAAAVTLWIDSNQAILDGITSLKLDGKNLKVIPKGIEKCKNLTSLNLCWNNIDRFPRGFVWPSRLEKLSLRGNQLGPYLEKAEFPETLKYIDLGKNQIVSVPRNLKKLSELSFLDLSYNQIADLSKAAKGFAKLVELDLRDNQIEFIPHKVSWPRELHILRLAGNKIGALSYKIKWPPLLEELDLGRNQMERISPEMSWPTQLQSIFLDENKLTYISERILQLPELRTLDVEGNQIGNIDSLCKMIPRRFTIITSLFSIHRF